MRQKNDPRSALVTECRCVEEGRLLVSQRGASRRTPPEPSIRGTAEQTDMGSTRSSSTNSRGGTCPPQQLEQLSAALTVPSLNRTSTRPLQSESDCSTAKAKRSQDQRSLMWRSRSERSLNALLPLPLALPEPRPLALPALSLNLPDLSELPSLNLDVSKTLPGVVEVVCSRRRK